MCVYSAERERDCTSIVIIGHNHCAENSIAVAGAVVLSLSLRVCETCVHM